MGNQRSSEYLTNADCSDRRVFVSFISYKSWPAESYSPRYDSYSFLIKYQRYRWTISKRFSEIMSLDSDLYDEYPEKIDKIKRPRKYAKLFWKHNNDLLTRRANDIVVFLQTLVDDFELMQCRILKEFLEIGETSLRPQLGRKGKEGYLRKCSGGYLQNYSSRTGDFIKTWRKRWFVLHDNYIAYYKYPGDIYPLGCFQIDPKFNVAITGRIVTISNRSRRLVVFGSSQRVAVEWAEACSQFYAHTPRKYLQLYGSSYPPRPNTSVRLYVCGKEYFTALAVALMQAKEEILIASWMVSPTLLLTRPPLPPLRLDQLLKYKAERGVKIYVLLYKEVEMSGLGNDSLKCRTHLEALSPNINVLRHPNKLLGGSTAILWSHHEKLVIIDRNMGFIGGIDPCFGRWDDEKHLLTDEDGVLFPGRDYYQPARGLFKPAQEISDDFLVGKRYSAGEGMDESDGEEGSDGVRSECMDEFDEGDKYSEASSSASASSWAADDSAVDGGVSRLPKSSDPSKGNKSYKTLTTEEINVLQGKENAVDEFSEQARNPPSYIDPPSYMNSTNVSIAPPAPYNTVEELPEPSEIPSQTVSPSSLPHDDQTGSQPQVFMVSSIAVNAPSAPPTFHVASTTVVSAPPPQVATAGSRPQSTPTVFNLTANIVHTPASSGGAQMATIVGGPQVRPHSVSSSQFPQQAQSLTAQNLAQARRSRQHSRSQYSHMSAKSSSQSSLYAAPAVKAANSSGQQGFSLQSMMDSIQMFSDSMADKMEKMKNDKKKEKVDDHQARELFPRMPWHDVHACITGLPARDLSAHFVQRWNHHRVSKGQTNVAILTDVTDNPHFSICAKCDKDNIYEDATVCPQCNHDLGPAKKSLTYRDYTSSGKKDDALEGGMGSYMSYECFFSNQLGCRIQGDGPTLVTMITNPETVSKISRGAIVERAGESSHVSYMLSQGLRPIVGDILVSVEDTTVLHLNSAQVQRYILRCRGKIKQQILRDQSYVSDTQSIASSRISLLTDRKIRVVFRRYYVNDVSDIVRHDHKARLIKEESLYKETMKASMMTAVAEKIKEKDECATRDDSGKKVEEYPENEGKIEENEEFIYKVNSKDGIENSVGEECLIDPAELAQAVPIALDYDTKQGSESVSAPTSALRPVLLSSEEESWDHEAARIDLVCRTCTSKEVYKGMFDLQKEISTQEVLPNPMTLKGTCQVQVLRSVGPWSVGHSPESSIQTCWIQTIQNAQHFIYIENQFFIGSLAGTDVKNGIAKALLDRLVLAAQREEDFRAIVVVPMHPEGDYISSSGPRGVMNYQYKTICRGAKSLIEQFKAATRGKFDPLEYICFSSLRNWGQLDDKVMFDQIYVHDKLLIVDDRVMIMGSANINDRSMMGDRDTEMAIRIEDTAHVNASMNGKHWVVGIVPHMFRKKLMAKHVDDMETDFSDPICDRVYHETWLRIAHSNTALYDELDGPLSYERCLTVEAYEKALAAKPFLDANDPLVESFLVRIKGHLVMWPLQFLQKENMLSAATQALASDLFA